MKKHRIISIALSVIGFAATLALVLYLLKDRIKGCSFCGDDAPDEAEEDIFDSDLDDLEDFVPVEKEEAKPFTHMTKQRKHRELFIICIISDLKGCRLSCSL